MKFCPKDSVMLTHKGDKFVCSKCGYSTSGEKIHVKEKTAERKEVAIIDKDDDKDYSKMPVVHQKCPKCGNMKAHGWSKQTRSSDEGETSFFQCTKCEHTWRSYR